MPDTTGVSGFETYCVGREPRLAPKHPEGITITDNAIIPLKERVVDRAYDPLKKLAQLVTGYSLP